MSLIIILTAGVGFLSSAFLLHSGMTVMWQRYPLSVAIAYAAFLFFLWCWLRWRDLYGNIDFTNQDSNSHGGKCEPGDHVPESGIGELPDFREAILDGEELALILVAILFLLALLFATFWIIWITPNLFAEILVDAALARGLYRRLPMPADQHWLQVAIQKTVWPFLLTAVVLGASGSAMQHYIPAAVSIGQVFSPI